MDWHYPFLEPRRTIQPDCCRIVSSRSGLAGKPAAQEKDMTVAKENPAFREVAT
jgi:hypothetical protein